MIFDKAYHKGGSVGTHWVPDWITVGVLQVQTRGGFLDQLGFAVRVFLWVTSEVGVGRQWSGRWFITISSSQMILQALHVIRSTDAQQLSLLLLENRKHSSWSLSELVVDKSRIRLQVRVKAYLWQERHQGWRIVVVPRLRGRGLFHWCWSRGSCGNWEN